MSELRPFFKDFANDSRLTVENAKEAQKAIDSLWERIEDALKTNTEPLERDHVGSIIYSLYYAKDSERKDISHSAAFALMELCKKLIRSQEAIQDLTKAVSAYQTDIDRLRGTEIDVQEKV